MAAARRWMVPVLPAMAAILVGAAGMSLVAPTRAIGIEPPASDRSASERPASSQDLDFAHALSRAFASAAKRIEPSVVHITAVTSKEVTRRDAFGRSPDWSLAEDIVVVDEADRKSVV